MNFYEQQLERFRRNFDFSLKIYEGRPLEQKALCIQMEEKVEHFRIPKNFSALSRTSTTDQLYSRHLFGS